MYNNCFTLAGGAKMPAYVNERGKLILLNKQEKQNLQYYHLSYNDALAALDFYKEVNGNAETSGRVSLYLEDAQWNDLHLFCIDFDETNESGSFFKAAYALADKVTRSKSGGYHMWYGVDKEIAEPLFDSINLTASRFATSFVSYVKAISTEGDIVDMFCDSPRLIYEFEEWDISQGVTDKTAALYKLLSGHFTFKKAVEHSADDWEDAEDGGTTIEGLPEDVLRGHMNTQQQLIFDDLKTIDCNCTATEWKQHGFNIHVAFGGWDDDKDIDLGGSVFLWWSKRGYEKKFQGSNVVRVWNWICRKKEKFLSNPKWDDILNPNAFENKAVVIEATIESQLAALPNRHREPAQADGAQLEAIIKDLNGEPDDKPLTFRGLPIDWTTIEVTTTKTVESAFDDDDTDETTKDSVRIEYEGEYYTLRQLLAAHFPAFRSCAEKVLFKNDSFNKIGHSQRRRAAYYVIERQRNLVEVDAQDKIDIARLIHAAPGTKTQVEKSIVGYEGGERGVERLITFGVMPIQADRVSGAWCYSPDFSHRSITYKQINRTWEEWALGIEKVLNASQGDEEEQENNIFIAVSYQDKAYLTLPADYREQINAWIAARRDGEDVAFPFWGSINGDDDESFKIDIEGECEIVRLGTSVKKTESNRLLGEKSGAKKTKSVFERLSGDQWTTAELHEYCFHDRNIQAFLKQGLIRRVKRGVYERA